MTFLLGRARTDVVDRKTQSETRATVRADTEVQTRAGCEGGGHHEPWRDVHAGHVFAMGVIDDREGLFMSWHPRSSVFGQSFR